ncbi:MAG: OB-fold nucleic acid binding domain-containing protein, partial [Thermomicrobiales bacterium]
MAETALDALRAEWRAGFNGRTLERDAMPALIHLRIFAHTRQADAALAEIHSRLARYRDLTLEDRKATLLAVAEELKALEPDFRQADAPTRPVGKLSEAVAPGRIPAPLRRPPPVAPPISQIRNEAPVTALPRVGDSVAKKLANLRVETVADLLSLNPRTYIDYTKAGDIGSITGFGARDHVTVRGEVVDLREIRGPGRPRVMIRLADETGWVRVTWFNIFIAKQVQIGDRITVSGLLDAGYGPPSFTGPEWEHVEGPGLSTGRLTPVYPLTKGIAQKTMRWLTRAALDATKSTVEEFLPPLVFAAQSLLPLVDAYEQVHFPVRTSSLDEAHRRLAFDSLFLLQLGMVRRRRERKNSTGIAMPADASSLDLFRASLPFALTGAQDRVLAEVLTDLADERPMTRL